MSIDSVFGKVQSITNTIERGINTVVRAGADLGLGGVGGSGAYWKDRLRPASYRGIPFAVLEGEGNFGRRNVVHEYPFRDAVWVEDLGRMARRIAITGFLVEDGAYFRAGGPGFRAPVIGQRERLIAAVESPGDGELVHPTLGALTVSLLNFSTVERWDEGRVFELHFEFVEAGKRQFPAVETSTGDAVQASCNAADYAAANDFASKAASALKQGAAVVQQAVNTVQKWTRFAQKLSNDATNLYNLVGSLKGSFGRYSGGRRAGGLTGKIDRAATSVSTVAGLMARGASVRQNVSAAIDKLSSAASGLGS